MIKKIPLLILVALTFTSIDGFNINTSCDDSHIIYHNNFNDDPTGIYTQENLEYDWNYPKWHTGIRQKRVVVVAGEEAYEGKTLRILYPKRKIRLQSGAFWTLRLNKKYDELYCSYRIKFSEGFDFVRGGKLPGLAGGKANAGGQLPDGRDGWSARIMWRAEGQLVQYVYHPDQPGKYGEDFVWKTPPLKPNTWYQVETRIVMNTPGEHNGIIQSWLNGKMVLDIQNIRFRDTNEFSIDVFKFNTFFGGNKPDWQPLKDQYVYIDEVIISTVPTTH